MDAAQVKQILTKVDHTLLRVAVGGGDRRGFGNVTMRYDDCFRRTSSFFVERAEAYGRHTSICTVI